MDVGVFDPLPMFQDGLIAALASDGHRVQAFQPQQGTSELEAAVVTLDEVDRDVSVSALIADDDALIVVALLASDDPGVHRNALSDGARATVFRNSPFVCIRAALQAASSDISSVPTAIVHAAPTAVAPRSAPSLQEEEAMWLVALAEGKTVRYIAKAEGRSERDMYRVLKRLYVRLGAEGRVDAIVRAAKWGLLG